jgi:hypothetical protein
MNTGVAFRRTLDIYPMLGMVTQLPAKELPLGASPDMLNMCVVGGCLRKRPGYRAFPLSILDDPFDASVQGLMSTQDENNDTHLYACTQNRMYKYDSDIVDWPECTGPLFTGGPDDMFQWEVSQNSVVTSQGIDPVVRTPFTTTYAVLSANCPAAKYMTRGADRLILAHTLESALPKPFRIRRSVASDHTDWTGVGSGFTDLGEFPYHLKNIRKIGTRIAAYTEKAVWIGVRTGNSTAPLEWQPIITESGLYAQYTLKGRRNLHMYLGTDDVYEFNGTGATGVGAPILDEIFRRINAEAIHKMFAETLNETQEYLCFVCTGHHDDPDRVWVYNWARGIWYPWNVDGPRCATTHRLDGRLIWDDIEIPWDEYPVEWDEASQAQAFPALLTGHRDGCVYKWGLQHPSDSGTLIPCHWSSKELSASDVSPQFVGKQITLRGVTVSYRSTGVAMTLNFSYRVDGGPWQGPYPKVVAALPGGDRTFTVDDQVSGGRVQFRVAHSSLTQTLIINSFHPEIEIRDYQAR